jgi:O-antigen ligase
VAGDCVWRVNGRRVSSVAEIDDAIKRAPTGQPVTLSLITRGEHVERAGAIATDAWKSEPSPSGIRGTHGTHRFRASGWTRHYETFAETVQIVAQLALGFALAHIVRRDCRRRRTALFAAAFALLACGVALTAMRTATVALVCGAAFAAWRAGGASRRARLAIACVVLVVLALGALAVWRTRDAGALSLRDPSARLRVEVARVALARVPLHPVFGHGMDAVHLHWHEWGFPGEDMLHAHSTPLQLAFDRGIPALLFWLWLMLALWLTLARAEKIFRETPDAMSHGLLLGATGALTGFCLSSLVNYNFGDAEVALMLWWLMGTIVRVAATTEMSRSVEADEPSISI